MTAWRACSALAAGVTLAAACSAASPSASTCPTTPPKIGDDCAFAEGTACTYSVGPDCTCCGPSVYVCSAHVWAAGPPQPPPGCPSSVPDEGAGCNPPCASDPAFTCEYACGTKAACSNGAWLVTVAACRDAGAD